MTTRDIYIITGAAGFIGANLVAALNARGHDRLILVDWLGDGAKWRNLMSARYLDLIFPEQLPDALAQHGQRIAGIFHLGANAATTARDGDTILRTNVHASMALWRWCTEHKCPLIYASSAATYGDGNQGFDDQKDLAELTRLQPLNLYGWSKHTFDLWALQRAAASDAPPHWAGLKFFNVYGPFEDHKGDMMSLVTKRWQDSRDGRPITLFKSHRPDVRDGEQQRDFVYVKDCAAVMMWMMDRAQGRAVNGAALSGLFNLGTGKARSFRVLMETLAASLGTTARINYVDMPPALRDTYQYFTEAPILKLSRLACPITMRSIEDGITDYVTTHLTPSGRTPAAAHHDAIQSIQPSRRAMRA